MTAEASQGRRGEAYLSNIEVFLRDKLPLADYLDSIKPVNESSPVTILVFTNEEPEVKDRITNPAIVVWTDGEIQGVDFLGNLNRIRSGRDRLRIVGSPTYIAGELLHKGSSDASIYVLSTSLSLEKIIERHKVPGVTFIEAPKAQPPTTSRSRRSGTR